MKDDADIWMETMGQNIQDYAVPPSPIEEPEVIEPEEEETITASDVRNHANSIALRKPTAEIIVGTTDMLLPAVLCLLIKHTDTADYKLQPDEQETLVNAWANYLGEKSIDLSPGWALIGSIATIYGSKLLMAFATRKERHELEQMRQERKEMQRQIEELKTMVETRQRHVSNDAPTASIQ